jgi:hypothetical protein
MEDFNTWQKAISKLRRAGNATIQFEALLFCSQQKIFNPGTLKNYHDALLFVCAYPYNQKNYMAATEELKRLTSLVKHHQHNKRWQYALSGSGLPFSEIRCQYSADLIQWLLKKFPEQVRPVESDEPGDAVRAICRALLPAIEFHLSATGNWNTWNRIKLLSGHYHNPAALKWLLNLLSSPKLNPLLKDKLYDELKIFVKWELRDDQYNRSSLRLPASKIHFRKPGKRKIKIHSFINEPLKKSLTLKSDEKEELIDIIRASLAFYQRETDPVTYADPSETSLFEMGDGLQIVLTGMNRERRLSIESYIGFMAFKNGIPTAYGGGWIFGYRCEIGINIYPPFRGGESEKLFCHVIQLYHQYFKLRKFIVKPYQFGKGNPEGINSGAFRFYYKLGFRPVEKTIKKLADKEWKKITASKSYRSAESVLKKFTACNLEWETPKSNVGLLTADLISKAVTQMINERYKGNRDKAIRNCIGNLNSFLKIHENARMDIIEKKVRQNWSLLFSCLQGTEKWNTVQRKKFLHILQLKSKGNERDFIVSLQRHVAFRLSLKRTFLL